MINNHELKFLEALSGLTYCNPFHRERIEWERKALGKQYVDEGSQAWSRNQFTKLEERSNVVVITQKAEELVEKLQPQFIIGTNDNVLEVQLYEDLVTYILYYRHFARETPQWDTLFRLEKNTSMRKRFEAFNHDHQHYLGKRSALTRQPVEHLFACLYQVRRAFHHIFECIMGDSKPIVELRGKVWQSIFTHQMRRYQYSLFERMTEIPTLITGQSGTGKELVARSIALAQFVPFDAEKGKFFHESGEAFIPLNLTALSPTLIESELFGHKKGSFTGAVQDKVGWLERCGRFGTIFLDEIGELDPVIQVKLLRVIQNRTWARLGETKEEPFLGKFMAATNRELGEEIEGGRFRLDLYYRLCADHIQTPTLRDQLDDQPDALIQLVQMMTEKIAGDQAEEVTHEVVNWIDQHLEPKYSWPGNVRELEQCVRNIMVRNEYVPLKRKSMEEVSGHKQAFKQLADAGMTMLEIQRAYTTWMYAQIGTYEGTAEKLGLDRRTIKSWVDEEMKNQLK
jgi:transcriptional regulator with AAA-type ATPase domain